MRVRVSSMERGRRSRGVRRREIREEVFVEGVEVGGGTGKERGEGWRRTDGGNGD